ncbi:family 20 glycosylhydrolase [Bacteroides ovatus]|uniref:beta-N-acetylhexosaminidase n=1 Tax=Bacteroides ovatus TaxID=28116 RepID=A0A1G8J785_BACOV|nr:family 20 glycosylhydrolase [Bacteroides ovatus]SDI27138.1 hexosaminidase [Bacteroides ovatus]
MRSIVLFILFLGSALNICIAGQKEPILLRWSVTPCDNNWKHTLKFINRGTQTLEDGWSIYYGSVAPVIEAPPASPVGVEQICGSHHRFYSKGSLSAIAAGDSLQVEMYGAYIDLQSFHPENPYLVCKSSNGLESMPENVALQFTPYHDAAARKNDVNYPTGERVYEANARFADAEKLGPYDILPALKSVQLTGGSCRIGQTFVIKAGKGLENEALLLKENLTRCPGYGTGNKGTKLSLQLSPGGQTNDEAYHMSFSDKGIVLSASTPHGIHNACQSLLAILSGKHSPVVLPSAEINDSPDFSHRGLMFDIARNFTKKENIFKLIDVLSLYKMNVLHLHLVDDEGWRLEIPGLEELTEIGARRGHTLTESDCLYPSYGSGWNVESVGSGYYTCDDFIEILKYATRRHIKVIPEIDVPGHSRAAIKAMNARYAKYIDSNPEKAREFLLADFDDTSVYRSAQDYHDNVMNIAMPSAYTFIRKVIGEVQRMYATAGAELSVLHVGGDEVPRGAWEGSPVCEKFMTANQLSDVHALKNYFMNELHKILSAEGIRLAGWQEIVMLPDGKQVNPDLPGEQMLSYCWNTTPGEGFDEISYSLANAGYPIILCNVTNLYMDLAYNKHSMETGHQWGGYIDAVSTFNMLPYDIYKSIRTMPDGKPANLGTVSEGKVKLKPEARQQILGVQGQLWTETLRNFEMAEYLLFPKLYGLAERAWNSSPVWETDTDDIAYSKDLKKYNTRISTVEMPRIALMNIHFRVSPPGIKIGDGMLHANTPETGATIHYTLDGSEPTEQSPRWTQPVPCPFGQVKARSYYCGHGSVVTEL